MVLHNKIYRLIAITLTIFMIFLLFVQNTAQYADVYGANLHSAKSTHHAAPQKSMHLLTQEKLDSQKKLDSLYTAANTDAFFEATNLKGLQGMFDSTYGAQHTLINLMIDRYIDDNDPGTFGYCYPYEYNGKTFYMDLSGVEMVAEIVRDLNEKGITVSMVFLLEYTSGREFLIDEAARIPGHTFYAPAAQGDGLEAIGAFFSFFMERLDVWNAHVDNFILGNEINNANSWHFSNTLNAGTIAQKYATTFCRMYNIVKSYHPASRCSISLDHNWAYNDRGREIAGKTMLQAFAAAVDAIQPNVDWCISYHLYPAIMTNNAIWRGSGYNANNESAMFIDGGNLHVLTNFVKNNYGEQHRIMLTEQGFSSTNEQYQAAALAISYYAAKYDPMVDCFILYTANDTFSGVCFAMGGQEAERIYEMIDDGNEEHTAEIEQMVLNVTGRTLESLVPNYGVESATSHSA